MNDLRIRAACAAVLCLIVLAASAPTFAAPITAAPQTDKHVAAWLEDIDYLVERLQVMHPDLYAYNAPGELDAAVADLKHRVPQLTDNEIVFGIHEIVALLHDAHSSVVPWKMGECELTDGWYAYPLSFYRFADGMYILAAAEKYRDLVGKRIVKFGAVDPDEAVARTGRLVGADNAQGRLVMGSVYLMVAEALEYCGIAPEPRRLTLALADADGRETRHTLESDAFADALQGFYQIGKDPRTTVVMNAASAAPQPLYLSHPGDSYWFEYLPEHEAMYVSLLSMDPKQEEDFETFYARLFREIDEKKARKLILDVRHNGGGDHHEMPLLKGVIARPHLDDREQLFVITGRVTVSASQHFVTQFKMYTNATFVGESTSAKPNFYGAQRFFSLPNSSLQIRSSVIFHQDETGWEMAGTSHPDYLVELDGADFAANRDPVLDVVLNFEEYADFPALLEKAMGDAYEAGGIGAMEDAFHAFLSAHPDAHIDDYAFFGDFIWWMFRNRKSAEDYGEFLEFYTRRCPDSSGAWYSLGSRRKIAGDPDGALRCFERALEAYPGNQPAKMQRDLILFDRKWAGE